MTHDTHVFTSSCHVMSLMTHVSYDSHVSHGFMACLAYGFWASWLHVIHQHVGSWPCLEDVSDVYLLSELTLTCLFQIDFFMDSLDGFLGSKQQNYPSSLCPNCIHLHLASTLSTFWIGKYQPIHPTLANIQKARPTALVPRAYVTALDLPVCTSQNKTTRTEPKQQKSNNPKSKIENQRNKKQTSSRQEGPWSTPSLPPILLRSPISDSTKQVVAQSAG